MSSAVPGYVRRLFRLSYIFDLVSFLIFLIGAPILIPSQQWEPGLKHRLSRSILSFPRMDG